MKLDIGGQAYTVRVWYRVSDGDETLVTLLKQPGDVACHSGLAYCAPCDQFCKATGRKIAFGRMLAANGFSKDERRRAWDQYFAQVGHGNGPGRPAIRRLAHGQGEARPVALTATEAK